MLILELRVTLLARDHGIKAACGWFPSGGLDAFEGVFAQERLLATLVHRRCTPKITCIPIDGVEYFIVSEVGEAFGYEDSSELAKSINKYWRSKFLRGNQAIVAEGDLLAEIKRRLPEASGGNGGGLPEASGDSPLPSTPVSPYASHLMLITEGAINRAAGLSDAPNAEDFWEWVCEVLLPTLRKKGSYKLAGGTGDPLNEKRLACRVAEVRESHLMNLTRTSGHVRAALLASYNTFVDESGHPELVLQLETLPRIPAQPQLPGVTA